MFLNEGTWGLELDVDWSLVAPIEFFIDAYQVAARIGLGLIVIVWKDLLILVIESYLRLCVVSTVERELSISAIASLLALLVGISLLFG